MNVENTMSIEELRRELRMAWDDQQALLETLRDLPEFPPVRVMSLLSEASSVRSNDSAGGKRIQRDNPGTVPYKSECERGMGFYFRLRQGLLAFKDLEQP